MSRTEKLRPNKNLNTCPYCNQSYTEDEKNKTEVAVDQHVRKKHPQKKKDFIRNHHPDIHLKTRQCGMCGDEIEHYKKTESSRPHTWRSMDTSAKKSPAGDFWLCSETCYNKWVNQG